MESSSEKTGNGGKERKPYHKPELTNHGTIEQITQLGPAGNMDGVATMSS